jgi:hypothetical protein
MRNSDRQEWENSERMNENWMAWGDDESEIDRQRQQRQIRCDKAKS